MISALYSSLSGSSALDGVPEEDCFIECEFLLFTSATFKLGLKIELVVRVG